MSELELALAEATGRIGAFLKHEKPSLDPLFQALATVGPLLPAGNPSVPEEIALQDYRRGLEQLQPALDCLMGRLWSQRAVLQQQAERLKVLRVYGWEYHRDGGAPGI